MDERGRLGVKRCAEKNAAYQTSLFTRAESEWVEVDVKRVRVERSRKFGGPWLGRELLLRLELERSLEETLPNGREEIPWSAMAMILILGRLCELSSELHLAEHLYEASAMSDLLGVPEEKVNEDRLYRALDTLLSNDLTKVPPRSSPKRASSALSSAAAPCIRITDINIGRSANCSHSHEPALFC
jgi:hypothetical protein